MLKEKWNTWWIILHFKHGGQSFHGKENNGAEFMYIIILGDKKLIYFDQCLTSSFMAAKFNFMGNGHAGIKIQNHSFIQNLLTLTGQYVVQAPTEIEHKTNRIRKNNCQMDSRHIMRIRMKIKLWYQFIKNIR